MVDKEIGGYFGLERLIEREYYPDLIAVNNARNALVYLKRVKSIRKIYLPFFLCSSVADVCKRENLLYDFYHIDKNFLPVFNSTLGEDEYLYIVNYYGQFDNIRILELKKQYGRIIVDNVQAFFQEPAKEIDTIYSCRKFFGVPDGGYLSTNAESNIKLSRDKSKDRIKHLLGRFEDGVASEYYADFKANDRSFATIELRAMSDFTHNILGAIDYDRVRLQRNKNFKILHETLGQRNSLSISVPEGPYAYPFYCRNGMEIKKKLAQKKIYVATLWPNVLDLEGTLEKDFAENILPLPCDQRYDAEDMMRIIQEVVSCIG